MLRESNILFRGSVGACGMELLNCTFEGVKISPGNAFLCSKKCDTPLPVYGRGGLGGHILFVKGETFPGFEAVNSEGRLLFGDTGVQGSLLGLESCVENSCGVGDGVEGFDNSIAVFDIRSW